MAIKAPLLATAIAIVIAALLRSGNDAFDDTPVDEAPVARAVAPRADPTGDDRAPAPAPMPSASQAPEGPVSPARDGGQSPARIAAPSPDRIVERLPAANRDPLLRSAAQRATAPVEASARWQLAERHLAQLRATGDPRHGGRALAVLSDERVARDPHARLLKADLLQHLHRFDESARLLKGLESELPDNRARFLLAANVARVQGRIADARTACQRADAIARDAWSAVCLADLAMLDNDLSAWRGLNDGPGPARGAGGGREVLLTVWLGDLAERAGDDLAAERFFRRAQFLGGSSFAVHRHAQFLLRASRADEAARLLDWWQKGNPHLPDTLVLDQAIAAHLAGDPEKAAQFRAAFEARNPPDTADGTPRHWRELARHALVFGSDARRALQYAKANWATQKEPVDAWLLDRAASQARDPDERARLRRELIGRQMSGVAAWLDTALGTV